MKVATHFNQLWNRRRHTDRNWCTYLFFAVLRVVLVLIPQTGYIHPDEFFQSVEVMTADHYRLEHIRTWEFNNTMPLRSITLPFLLIRLPWSLLDFCALYARELLGVELLCSYMYLVFPRLIMCGISFVSDWSLYRVCRLYSLHYEIRLLALGSSWVMLVFGTRTFSNTVEMVLCSLLLYLVAECMIRTNTVVYKKEFLEERYDKATSIAEKVKIWKLKGALPAHNFSHLLLLASVCVAGVFNRPTFLLFGAPMVFYWMLRGMGTKSITFRDFNLRMLLFCIAAIPALCFFTVCDSLYYRHLTVGEMQMFKVGINNFIFTPWNFVKYNLDPNKTAEHGLHPRYIHLLVNIPLLYNVLGVIALIAFAQLMIRFFRAEYQGLPRAQSIISLMSGAVFVPLFFLSLINHQEARFLIPLLFPIVLLHAPKLVTGFCVAYPFKEEHPLLRKLYNSVLCPQASANYILKVWYVSNIVLTVLFGFVHQAGVFPLAQYVEHAMHTKATAEHLHLVTSHMYSLPVSFVNIPNSQTVLTNRQTGQRYQRQKDFYLYEYGDLSLPLLVAKIKLIASHCEMKLSTKKQKYRLYLAIPTSLSEELASSIESTNATSYMRRELKHIIYPHLSTEALPRLFGRHPCDVHPSGWTNDEQTGTCRLEQTPTLSYSYVSRQLSSVVHQLGLALYEFEVKRQHPPPQLETRLKQEKTTTNAVKH